MFEKKMFCVLFSILLISSRLFGAAAPTQPLDLNNIKALTPSRISDLNRHFEGGIVISSISSLNAPTGIGSVIIEAEQAWRNTIFISLKTMKLLAKALGTNTTTRAIRFMPGTNIMADSESSNGGKLKIIPDSLHDSKKYKIFDGSSKLCAYSDGDDQRDALLAVGANKKGSSTVTLFKYSDLKLDEKETSISKQAKDNAKVISMKDYTIDHVQFSKDGRLLVVLYANNHNTGGGLSKLLLHQIGKDASKEVVFDLGVGENTTKLEKHMHLTEHTNILFIHACEFLAVKKLKRIPVIFELCSGVDSFKISVQARKNRFYELSCDTGVCKELFYSENGAFFTDNAGMKKAVAILNACISKKRMNVDAIFVTPNETGSLVAVHITNIAKGNALLILLGKYYKKKKSGYRVVGTYDHDHFLNKDRLSVAFDDEEGKLYLSGFGQGHIAVFDGIVNNEIPQLQNLCAACIRENKKKIDPSVLPKLIRDLFALHVASSSGKRSGGKIEQQNPKKQRLP